MGAAQTLAHNLRRLRTADGLTLAQVAEVVGVTRQAVSAWERGIDVPRPSALDVLAVLYGVPVAELFREEAPSP